MWQLVLLLVLAGCVTQRGVDVSNMLTTDDNQNIAYTLYAPQKANGAGVILIHMLGRDRKDWDSFAKQLQTAGYTVVAIDMRGHGESSGKWKSFSDDDFRKIVLDVKAAKAFLEKQSIDAMRIAVVGASIGANTALNYAVGEVGVKTVVLLSPGLEYRGVKTEESMHQFARPVLIVASKEDEYSASSADTLFVDAKGEKELKMYDHKGHGTEMFKGTDLGGVIMSWLQKFV